MSLTIKGHTTKSTIMAQSFLLYSCQSFAYLNCTLQEAAKEHDSCINNLHNAMNAIGHPLTDDPDHYLPPSPFNLWMAVSLKNEGSQLSWDPPHKVSSVYQTVQDTLIRRVDTFLFT